MTAKRWLEELLATDPTDAGCDGSFDQLDPYVEAELSPQDAVHRFPAAAAHLRGCPSCRQDYDGRLA